MGLLGGKKIYVASTVYNLAGDEKDRPNYLKTIVTGNVLLSSKFSMSDSLRSAYMNGPGIKARSLYRWAERHYGEIGVPTMELVTVIPQDNSAIVPYLPVPTGQTAVITKVEQGVGDITRWVERFILSTYPERFDTDWDISSWDGTTVEVTFEADGFKQSFVPADPEFDGEAQYFYVYYDRKTNVDTIAGKSLWIYQVGSGISALDNTVQAEPRKSKFYPFIPIRHETKFFSNSYHRNVYELSKKAYKKATGQKLDKLIEKIADNESIGDIDYAYIVYAVPMNARDNSARKYLFNFFKSLIPDVEGETKRRKLVYQNRGSTIAKLTMVITWDKITLTSGAGLKRANAKVGDVWLTPWNNSTQIIHQVTQNRWEMVTVDNLLHQNLVYGNKAVNITANEALWDADESGFLVPLHYETVRKMSLVDSTQMMTAGTFIVFNSYKIVKQKWYQTGIFKIIVFVAIVALTIVFAPAGAAAGAWLAIGTAIGLSGILAIVVGAVIMQLVTMLLMKILSIVGVAVFGEKFGMIFAAVATFVAVSMGTGMLNGQSLSSAWGSMMSASNLLQLTNAVGSGIAGYMQASTQGIIQDTQKLLDNYNKESKHVSELFAQNIGYGRGAIDPMSLTSSPLGNFMETEAQFLLRTLMTGSDIAELSMDMLTNYSAYTLSTDLHLGQ